MYTMYTRVYILVLYDKNRLYFHTLSITRNRIILTQLKIYVIFLHTGKS
jgi:hypothetical protein